MGCAEITGDQAFACLDYLQTRNLAGLAPGRIAYTLILREDGSVLNDATVWNLGQNRYALFVGRREDLSQVTRAGARCGADVADRSDALAVLAIQGPMADRVLREWLAPQPLPDLPYFGFASIELRGEHCWLARIGYSGERGCELIAPAGTAVALWESLTAAGIAHQLAECGFDATDSLRIEAGHPLFERELAIAVSPSELGLERLVEPYGRSFCGGAELRKALTRRLVGLLPFARGGLLREQVASALEPAPLRLRNDAAAMTSACFSPIFERWLALGFVRSADRHPGTLVTLGEGLSARVARLPFYDPAKRLPRAAG
jgi:aminomethyltransferase